MPPKKEEVIPAAPVSSSIPSASQGSDHGDPECRQHLLEFAEKLSERLLAEIDSYSQETSSTWSSSASTTKRDSFSQDSRGDSLESRPSGRSSSSLPTTSKLSLSSYVSPSDLEDKPRKDSSSDLQTSTSSLGETAFGKLEFVETSSETSPGGAGVGPTPYKRPPLFLPRNGKNGKEHGAKGKSSLDLEDAYHAGMERKGSGGDSKRLCVGVVSGGGSASGAPVSRETSLSMSTSQDSLQSDTGGALTFHRYYHVFREGELDQLIEKYVENLHIISSYYDHANWCIIAEKVQVWTI